MMTAFEYITVLISIILGMGITQIVTGIADMVTQWKRIKLYWPHLLWIGFVFFLHIQDWWETFNLQQFTSWKLSTFLFVILYPINLFILARMLFPFGQNVDVDFKAFYFESYRKFFVWVIILSLFAIINNVYINDYPWINQLAPASIMLGLGFILLRNYQQEWIHKAVVIILWSALLIVLWIQDFSIGA
jgi:hypothetical protein